MSRENSREEMEVDHSQSTRNGYTRRPAYMSRKLSLKTSSKYVVALLSALLHVRPGELEKHLHHSSQLKKCLACELKLAITKNECLWCYVFIIKKAGKIASLSLCSLIETST